MSDWASDDDCKPTSFDEMAIYPEAKEILQHFLTSGNIPHIIFHGDTGTGKTTAANILARIIMPNFGERNEFDCTGIISQTVMDKWLVQLVGKTGALTRFMTGLENECFLFDEFHLIDGKVQMKLNKPLEGKAKDTPCFFCVNDLEQVEKPIRSRCTIIPFDVCSIHPTKNELVMNTHHSWSEKEWKEELRRVGRIATTKKGYEVDSAIEDKVLAKNLCCVDARTYVRNIGIQYEMYGVNAKPKGK
jgi:DNA polymerase III delta prime subunit